MNAAIRAALTSCSPERLPAAPRRPWFASGERQGGEANEALHGVRRSPPRLGLAATLRGHYPDATAMGAAAVLSRGVGHEWVREGYNILATSDLESAFRRAGRSHVGELVAQTLSADGDRVHRCGACHAS